MIVHYPIPPHHVLTPTVRPRNVCKIFHHLQYRTGLRLPLIIIPVAGLVDCYGDVRWGYCWTSSVSGGGRAENDDGFRSKLLVVILAKSTER